LYENNTNHRIDNNEVLPSVTETGTDNFDNNHGGTIILPNLEVLDMPENVPHSEGLDIYLFDDSSFEINGVRLGRRICLNLCMWKCI
jgi:hypothetical protein